MSSQLYADLELVEARLQQSMRDIDGPLGDLVRPQLRRTQPYVRAGSVLTAAYCVAATRSHADDADGTDATAQQRTVALAAAVEMLHIALTLHRRLVQSSAASTPPIGSKTQSASENRADGTLDSATNSATNTATNAATDSAERTFFGSTILAGDYCFSRASQLAAETEHPAVVAHFAQTLQTLSEGLLRDELHTPEDKSGENSGKADASRFDADTTLLLAGVEGALLLHGQNLSPDDPIFAQARHFAQTLGRAPALAAPNGENATNGNHAASPVATPCSDYWNALRAWQQQAG